MRGLAIFFIVWGHIKGGLFLNSGADLSNSWWVIEKFIDTISIGGTSIFVFISGFLFYKIFYLRGFVYERFIISKCKKVLLPWFIIATTFTVMCLIKGYGHFSDVNFIYSSGYLYASFWYIPFIMVMFLCSPLHIKFIEGKDKIRIICLVLMTIFSMGLGRHNLNPFLSVIYWMPYYCFGIFIAIHYNIIISFSSNSKKSIFCLTILFLACLSSTNGQHLLKEYPPLKINLFESISFLVLGKYLLCICFLYFFEWFQKFSSNLVKRFLDILAKYSFSIFFLHQFVILHFERQPHKNLFSSMNFYEINLCAVFITILSIFACIAIAFLVKLIFGKYSRMIIGA